MSSDSLSSGASVSVAALGSAAWSESRPSGVCTGMSKNPSHPEMNFAHVSLLPPQGLVKADRSLCEASISVADETAYSSRFR